MKLIWIRESIKTTNECKSKLQDTTSHPSGWLVLKKKKQKEKKAENNKFWYSVGGNVKQRSCYRKQYDGFSKNCEQNYTWSSNSTSGYVPKGIKSWVSKRCLCPSVHSSIIHDSQKSEATQVAINRWTDKQNGEYTYNGILFNLKKEENSHSCPTWMDLVSIIVSERSQSIKRQTLYHSTYVRYPG